MVTTSAPGKLFILGEHAVVYGYPAIVAAINKRIFVTTRIVIKNSDEINTLGVSDNRFVRQALLYFKKTFQIHESIAITTRSAFSDTVGFGSSSAVTVATIASLNALFQRKLSNNDIFNLSYDVVKNIQGVASGADVAASVYGGITYYQKKEKTVVKKIECGKIHLIVGYSGVKADTVTIIKKVVNLYEGKKAFVENIFVDISLLVEKGLHHLEHKEYEQFGTCMNKNHALLHKLGVSTLMLDTMVKAALDAGAWGAKLSGAGGGDCIIAIGPQSKKQKIEEAIEHVGGEIIDVSISLEGTKII